MNIGDIGAALDGVLAAAGLPYPVAWEDVPFRPSTQQPYLAVALSGYAEAPAGAGPTGIVIGNGMYTISVVWPSGAGRALPAQLAAQIQALYPRGQSFALATGGTLIVIRSSPAPTVDDGAWVRLPVTIGWTANG
jgi:hypothetical protein